MRNVRWVRDMERLDSVSAPAENQEQELTYGRNERTTEQQTIQDIESRLNGQS